MINILITVDDNYIQHAAVMIASLLDNTNEEIRNICISKYCGYVKMKFYQCKH